MQQKPNAPRTVPCVTETTYTIKNLNHIFPKRSISLMGLQCHKKKIIFIVIALLVVFGIFITVVSPLYTKQLFKPVATKEMFPEYVPDDLDKLLELYGSRWAEAGVGGLSEENGGTGTFCYLDFDLDFTTRGYLFIYSSVEEAEDDFFVSVDDEPGCFLTNTDDFRVFIGKKRFLLFSDFMTEQTMYVQNGTNYYEIYKYKFSFSQEDFKASLLRMKHY
jgi:hypothetical protein